MLERIYATLNLSTSLYTDESKSWKKLYGCCRVSHHTRGWRLKPWAGWVRRRWHAKVASRARFWKSYDIVLGVQASKRQIRVDTRQIRSKVIRFDQLGTILRLRELLVTIAKQLDVQDPETRTDTDTGKANRTALEREKRSYYYR